MVPSGSRMDTWHGPTGGRAALVTSYGLHVTKFRLMAKSEIPPCLTATAALPRGSSADSPVGRPASNSLPAQLPWPPPQTCSCDDEQSRSSNGGHDSGFHLRGCSFPLDCADPPAAGCSPLSHSLTHPLSPHSASQLSDWLVVIILFRTASYNLELELRRRRRRRQSRSRSATFWPLGERLMSHSNHTYEAARRADGRGRQAAERRGRRTDGRKAGRRPRPLARARPWRRNSADSETKVAAAEVSSNDLGGDHMAHLGCTARLVVNYRGPRGRQVPH